MALSKKMKKILADFYALYYKYEEAYKKGNRKSAMYYGEIYMNYCIKFQKELKLSDEYMTDWKKTFNEYRAKVKKEELLMEELTAIRAHKKILMQQYNEALQKDAENGFIKWH